MRRRRGSRMPFVDSGPSVPQPFSLKERKVLRVNVSVGTPGRTERCVCAWTHLRTKRSRVTLAVTRTILAKMRRFSSRIRASTDTTLEMMRPSPSQSLANQLLFTACRTMRYPADLMLGMRMASNIKILQKTTALPKMEGLP